MAMAETKIANPVKSFKYLIAINGINQAKAQTVEIGTMKIEKVEHFDGGMRRKTPGMPEMPDITIEKLISEDGSDIDTWQWFQSAHNFKTNQKQPIASVLRDGTITLLDGMGLPVRVWIIENAWVCEFTPPKVGDGETGNAIDKVVLSVDKIYPQKI